ncbi:MAG: PAS domain S-box protein [Balneolaceae bacterium]
MNTEIMELNLLNSFPACVALLNSQAEVSKANKRWKENSSGSPFIGSSSIGKNYFHVLAKQAETGNDYALKMILGLRSVLDGEKESFSIPYSVSTEGAEKVQWLKVTIKPVDKEQEKFMVVHGDVTREYQTAIALRDCEDRYKQQFKDNIMGIILSNQEGEILECNPSAAAILGYDSDELPGLPKEKLMNMKNPDTIHALAIREQSGEFQGEMIFLNKRGVEIPVDVTSKLYRNEHAQLRVFTMFRDVSQKKAVEQELLKEQRLTKTAISSLPGLFVVLDQNGTLINWNDTMYRDLGYSEEELRQYNAFDIVNEKSREALRENLEQVYSTGHVVTNLDLNLKNGEVRTYRFRSNLFESGQNKYVVATGIDISENLKIEEEKKVAFELMSQLFDNAPVGMVLIDSEKKAERVNDKFVKMFGFNRNELVGKNVTQLISPAHLKEESASLLNKTFKGITGQQETVRLHKNGEEISILLATVPVSVNDAAMATYEMYVDISQRVKLEKRITDLFKMEQEARLEVEKGKETLEKTLHEKEVLLQEVHHRVKNNLAVITGLMDLQMMDGDDDKLSNRLKQVQSRIFAIAKIHESVYQQADVVHVELHSYFQRLTNQIIEMDEDSTFIDLDLRPVNLNLNQAVSCGLLINELLFLSTEAADGMSDRIGLKLSMSGNRVKIVLSADYIQTITKKDIETGELLNLKIVQVLLHQLKASYEFIYDEKNSLKITFEKTNVRGSSNAFLL